ncbi:Anthrone monooxygenase [Wenjunlia vitaminophila]|uniref:Anthrone monooxygenase n=1 Tax=Wenjunlia vitaminophila TaxID=76728 RepID=A0A0T6LU05_WENVI|nr:antibiotic biosynthesis monooxygenase [Wenjunlia vitaminophila]KRV49571.1 Anthrone monooxygenase [Wenjunlia vitaminophila]
MPFISPEDAHLTVLNLFTTDAPEKQDGLINEMTKIVNAAAYEGWISSTVHQGVHSPGTANLIQWRSGEDLEKRYAGEEFKHRTLPTFGELTTSIRLLQNEIVFSQHHPSLGDKVEISPKRDDHTVIEIFQVAQENLDELVDALGPSQDYLLEVAGYRSHTVFKGLRARGLEGSFAVCYSQWESKEAHDAFINEPQSEWSAARDKSESRIASLKTSSDWNSYQVVHTRSAGE